MPLALRGGSHDANRSCWGQGLWRRTTLESYKTGEPEWEEILDLDALSEKDRPAPNSTLASHPDPRSQEGESWVWHGYDLLDEGPGGAWDICLLTLSPGGSDASVVREARLALSALPYLL